MIERVSKAFSGVILVLNVGMVMDLSFAAHNDRIQGIVLAYQGGNEGAGVLTDILLGKINPSGKTVDTWAASYEAYPSSPFYNNSRVMLSTVKIFLWDTGILKPFPELLRKCCFLSATAFLTQPLIANTGFLLRKIPLLLRQR